MSPKKARGQLTHKMVGCLIVRNREMGMKAVLVTRAIAKRVRVGKKKRKTGQTDIRKVSEED